MKKILIAMLIAGGVASGTAAVAPAASAAPVVEEQASVDTLNLCHIPRTSRFSSGYC